MIEHIGWRLGRQGFIQLVSSILAGQASFQAAMPIVQPGMVTSDEVGEHTTCLGEPVAGQQGACRGMSHPSGDALDVRIHFETASLPDIALETGPILAQVVPQACQPRPVFAKSTSETGSQFSDAG